MSVNLFCSCALVEGDKAMQQIIASRVIVVAASVVREVVTQRGPGEFVCKEIDFVQEENLYEWKR
jgi:hypothetical protein